MQCVCIYIGVKRWLPSGLEVQVGNLKNFKEKLFHHHFDFGLALQKFNLESMVHPSFHIFFINTPKTIRHFSIRDDDDIAYCPILTIYFHGSVDFGDILYYIANKVDCFACIGYYETHILLIQTLRWI